MVELPPGMGDHKQLFVDDDDNVHVMDPAGNVRRLNLGGDSDYVFIRGIRITDEESGEDNPIIFDDIPQSYSHLLFECLLSSYSGDPTPSITWNDLVSNYKDQRSYIEDTSGPTVEIDNGGNSFISFMKNHVPESLAGYFGYAVVRIEFLYYSKTWEFRSHETVIPGKEVMWRGASNVGSDETSIATENGSGYNGDYNPITSVTFKNVDNGWAEGTIIQMYGIKGSDNPLLVIPDPPPPADFIEVDIDFHWGNYGTTWISETGSIPSVIDSSGSPFTLEDAINLHCNTAGTYHIVFDGTLSHEGGADSTSIQLSFGYPPDNSVLVLIDALALTDGYSEPLHVEGDWTFGAGDNSNLYGLHPSFDAGTTTLTGTLTITRIS